MASASALQKELRLQRRLAALAARPDMSPVGPAPDRFRVATWNVNSLRARAGAIARFLERVRPDVVCFQETKATVMAAEAAAVFDDHGYNVAYIGEGSYNGVAIASLHPVREELASGGFGDEHLDREPRLMSCVTGEHTPVRIVSVYVPHGREVGHWHYDYKLEFLDRLAGRVREWLAEGHLILAGDVNVAPTDSDIFHPDAFVGLTHVTPRERQAWANVLEAGLVDLDAARWGPRERRFTWWNHGLNYSRNLGMRLDVIAADRVLAASLDTTWIDHVERGAARPSDHAALIADFNLGSIG
jgi:exodeoxyribonuclease-3